MEMVRHNKFGVGEVIGREVVSSFTFLNVRFENGKKTAFKIKRKFARGDIRRRSYDFKNRKLSVDARGD